MPTERPIFTSKGELNGGEAGASGQGSEQPPQRERKRGRPRIYTEEEKKARKKDYNRRYYQEHIVELRERHRRWSQDHSDTQKEYYKRYHQENRDRLLERHRRCVKIKATSIEKKKKSVTNVTVKDCEKSKSDNNYRKDRIKTSKFSRLP